MNPELSRIVIAQRAGHLQAEAESYRLARRARRARRDRRAWLRHLRQDAPLIEYISDPNS